MTQEIDIEELRTVAEWAATEAGNLAREILQKPRQLSSKGFRDLVTDADIAAQKAITRRITERYPDHGFLTEEQDTTLAPTGRVIWIIDPVDGTSNYSRQVPIFCTSVAAAIASRESHPGSRPLASPESFRVVAGAIFDPMRSEMFSVAEGSGSYGNGQRLRASTTTNIENAIVGLDWSHLSANRRAMLSILGKFADKAYTVRAVGSAALALAWIAAGRLDAYFNIGVGPWDVAAAGLLIREAGGIVTTYQGQPWSLNHETCVASNGLIHERYLAFCRSFDAPVQS